MALRTIDKIFIVQMSTPYIFILQWKVDCLTGEMWLKKYATQGLSSLEIS